MLFGTEKEAREVMTAISDRENFEDLDPAQKMYIEGLYAALDVLESYEDMHCGDENEIDGLLGSIIDEVSCKAIETASNDVVMKIEEFVAYARDSAECE